MQRKIKLNEDSFYVQVWIILLVDILALSLAVMLANFIRFGNPFEMGVYTSEIRTVFLALLFVYSAVYFIFNSHRQFFRRSNLAELKLVLMRTGWAFLLVLATLFVFQITAVFSRLAFVYAWFFSVVLIWIFRYVTKKIMRKVMENGHGSHFVVLAQRAEAAGIIKQLRAEDSAFAYQITGLILVDEETSKEGENIEGVPVIGNRESMYTSVMATAVDELFISLPPSSDEFVLEDVVENYESLGLVVNVNIKLPGLDLRKHRSIVRNFNGYNALSFAKSAQDTRMKFMKRTIDIIGALVGLALSSVIILLVAPLLLLESPGPLFFSQVRIGKNGRKFKLYKLRSMYRDAEERKKELMAQNEMQGLMFKITNDPRITKVGAFIRKTSIDELPQFWNVLKGDMSLIGTRPPTLDEYELYKMPYKRRLSIRPGITGMWQVSGRSKIKAFEDVLALDLEYIDKWSPMLELKIILKTFKVVVFGVGAH